MWNSKERRVDFSVAILFVVWLPGGERNVFQSCCGRIRARAKKDHNVSVPRKFTLRFHVSYSNCIICGESTSRWRLCLWWVVWWRDKRISIVPWLGLANRRPLYIYSSTSVITRKGLVEKAGGTPRLQGDLYCGPLKSMWKASYFRLNMKLKVKTQLARVPVTRHSASSSSHVISRNTEIRSRVGNTGQPTDIEVRHGT